MEIPNALKVDGIRFVLIEKGGKRPFQNEWQNKNISWNNEELVRHISNGGNYGVMGGGSKNLIIIDFDNEELQNKVVPKLPETFTVKTGTGKLHKYYFTDLSESFKLFDEDMNTLADIQGEGKQVVGAGSIHPNGNRYEVIDNREINFLLYSEIKALLLPFDRRPKKEKKELPQKPKLDIEDNFVDKLKSYCSMESVLQSFGVDTSKNPTGCPLHSSKGGKCLGFNNDTAHCFHCEGSWNIFSLVKEIKNCDFKESLDYLANLVGLQDELEVSRRKYIEVARASERGKEREILFQVLTLSKDKKTGEATELLVNWIKERSYLYTTKDDNKTEMWVYDNGIYIPNGKSYVKEQLRKIMGEFYNTFYFNQVMAKLEPDTFIEAKEFFTERNIEEIPVINGILNLRTRQLKPFSPEKRFFSKVQAEYNPEARCPQIDKFLKEVLAKEDDRKIFYELTGYSLWKEYKFEKAFMFVGNGRNGKDKSLELIKRLVGPENACNVPLVTLKPDSFIISEFFGRMVNLAGEISNQDLKDTSFFKALTGRTLVSAPKKFLNAISFVNYAKFIFACNELPMVYDNSKGFWDRWVLLEFPYTFLPKEDYDKIVDRTPSIKLRDEDIIDKITTPEELSGLLNQALDGLDRLFINRTFSTTLGSEEVKNLWIRKSNSFLAFCLDNLENSYESRVSKKELRHRYSEYCKTYKVNPKSDKVIKITLENDYGASESQISDFGARDRYWEGIKWKN